MKTSEAKSEFTEDLPST